MIRVIETNNADDYDYDDFVVGDYVVDINLGGGSKYHGVFSTYEDACDHIDKNLPNNNGDYDKYISKRNKPSKKKGLFKKLFKRESNNVRMAEAYGDYKSTRALEKWLGEITYEQVKNGISKLDYFNENITCWIPIPYNIAVEVIRQNIKNFNIPISWLNDNQLWLQLEYHTDGSPTFIGLDYDFGVEEIKNVDKSVIDNIDGFYRKVLDTYRDTYTESKLTESDFTGDPLLPDVKDVYEELIRMYDVRKDVGYVETAKKMAEYVGGKANVSTNRTSFNNDYMEINWKVYGDFEFDGRNKTSYDGRNSILSDSYGNWLMYIEDLCMAFYKVNGGKGGYTPDLIKAIGKGY